MREPLSALAEALRYPGEATAPSAFEAARALGDGCPVLGAALRSLGRYVEGAGPGEPEEAYTRLFDLAPVCSLHAGYHLFGDAYQRGSLLAGLGEELRKAGLSAGEEIPDHLPLLLDLLPRLDEGDRQALAEALLLPALSRMAAALEGRDDPWAGVLRALPSAVTATLAAPPSAGAPAHEALHA